MEKGRQTHNYLLESNGELAFSSLSNYAATYVDLASRAA